MLQVVFFSEKAYDSEANKGYCFFWVFLLVFLGMFIYPGWLSPTIFPWGVWVNTILKIDNRGRLVIPTEFREALRLKDGDELLLSLDEKINALVLSPISGQQSNLIRIEIEFADTPGSLAKTANVIAKMNLDLIMTESKSFQRGKAARWHIIADRSRCPFPNEDIRKTLLQTGLATSVTIMGISPAQISP